MIQTILFDFGNVVGFFDHQRAVRHLLTHTDQTPEQLIQILYYGDLEVRYECGQISTRQVFDVVREVGRFRCTYEEFVEAFCDIFWPNPPVADLLPRLKRQGYRLVLASNTNDAHYTRYRAMFADTLKHFDAIAVSHKAGARKPDRRFYEYADQFTEANPTKCLFIDDMPENVEAARNFGWKAARYTTFDQLMADLQKEGVFAFSDEKLAD